MPKFGECRFESCEVKLWNLHKSINTDESEYFFFLILNEMSIWSTTTTTSTSTTSYWIFILFFFCEIYSDNKTSPGKLSSDIAEH